MPGFRLPRFDWPAIREDLRGSVVPLLWLLLGFVLARVYIRGLIFPADRLGPLPIYVPEALILAALLLTPQRRWWIYLAFYYVGSTVERVLVGGTPLPYVLLSNVVNVVQPLIGAVLVRRFVRSQQYFDSLRNVAIYIGCIVTAELIGSLWGASVRAIFMSAPFWTAWRGWFVGNVLAGLILTPTLILWITVDRRDLRARFTRHWAEALTLVVLLLVVSWLIFGTETLGTDLAPQLLYLPVPFLLWAAVRFGPRGITTALALFTVFAIAGAANQQGPFVGLPVVASIFELQLFLLGVGVPLFCLAVLVHERAQSDERYRAAVSNLPGGAVFLFGPDGRHLFADGEALARLGVARTDVEGRTPEEVFPSELAARLSPRYVTALAGRHESFELNHAGRTYRTDVSAIAGGGSPVGMVLLQDITDLRQAELVGAEMERARLARELHDSVSQTLFAASMTADALPRLLDTDPAAGRAAVAELRHMADSAQSEMRSLLLEMRPDVLTRAPLDELIPTLAEAAASRTGAALRMELDRVPVLPVDLQLAFYRIAQEALTNVTKHAAAKRVEIRLSFSKDPATDAAELALEVNDDGVGFDAADVPGGRLGLGSMRERAELVGASVDIVSRPGQGTSVSARWNGTLTSSMAQSVDRDSSDSSLS